MKLDIRHTNTMDFGAWLGFGFWSDETITINLSTSANAAIKHATKMYCLV